MSEGPRIPSQEPAAALVPPQSLATNFTLAQSMEINRRRRGRNIAMLVSLLLLSALFYAIAIVKLSGH